MRLLCILLLLIISDIRADIISIITVDTLDMVVGDTTEVDLANMDRFISIIAKNTKLKRKEVVLQDFEVVASILLSNLNQVEVSEDDIVIFYFSGHGYRTRLKGDSPWPYLFFSLDYEGIAYESVINILGNKNPRLLIIITDVCNNYLPVNGAPTLIQEKAYFGNNKKIAQKNYQKLFLDTSGTIFITSSKPGQKSYATNMGGYYTNAFLKSFYEEISIPGANWDDIFDRTSFYLGDRQSPIHQIEIL